MNSRKYLNDTREPTVIVHGTVGIVHRTAAEVLSFLEIQISGQ